MKFMIQQVFKALREKSNFSTVLNKTMVSWFSSELHRMKFVCSWLTWGSAFPFTSVYIYTPGTKVGFVAPVCVLSVWYLDVSCRSLGPCDVHWGISLLWSSSCTSEAIVFNWKIEECFLLCWDETLGLCSRWWMEGISLFHSNDGVALICWDEEWRFSGNIPLERDP